MSALSDQNNVNCARRKKIFPKFSKFKQSVEQKILNFTNNVNLMAILLVQHFRYILTACLSKNMMHI